MRELTFIKERDEALFVAYKNALRQPDVKSHQQAISIALHSPTSKFWVSPRSAYRAILSKKKGFNYPKGCRTSIIDDLYAEYLRMKDMPMFRGCSAYFISQFVVERPSPHGFGLSMLTAERIITRKRREGGAL